MTQAHQSDHHGRLSHLLGLLVLIHQYCWSFDLGCVALRRSDRVGVFDCAYKTGDFESFPGRNAVPADHRMLADLAAREFCH